MSDEEYPEAIAAIQAYRHDQQIYWVEGTLTKLYQDKVNTHGSIQNGEITDADGHAMKVTFADIPQPMSARNLLISLKCVQSQKHGWTGVKFKHDEQFGDAIWVTPSAQIEYPNGAPAAQRQQSQQPPRRPSSEPRKPNQPNQQRNAPPPQSRRPPPPPQNPTGGAKKESQFEEVARVASCYFHVYHLVNENMKPPLIPEGLTTAQAADLVSRAVATIFVDVAKQQTVARWNPKLQPRQYPEPPANPDQWEECYIDSPSSKLHGKRLPEVSDEDLLALFNYYDGKQANDRFAECVYRATEVRGLLKSKEEDEGGDSAEDQENLASQPDIPF